MLRCSILVVEGGFFAAEAIRDVLMDTGVAVVHGASGVRAALDSLVVHQVDAAVLDVDLGDHTSAPVADVLAARGIPFLFYTGGQDLPPPHQSVPVVRKPHFEKVAEALARICPEC